MYFQFLSTIWQPPSITWTIIIQIIETWHIDTNIMKWTHIPLFLRNSLSRELKKNFSIHMKPWHELTANRNLLRHFGRVETLVSWYGEIYFPLLWNKYWVPNLFNHNERIYFCFLTEICHITKVKVNFSFIGVMRLLLLRAVFFRKLSDLILTLQNDEISKTTSLPTADCTLYSRKCKTILSDLPNKYTTFVCH